MASARLPECGRSRFRDQHTIAVIQIDASSHPGQQVDEAPLLPRRFTSARAFRQTADGAQHPLFHHQIQRIFEEAREPPRAQAPRTSFLFAGAEQQTAAIGSFRNQIQRPRRRDLGVALGQIQLVLPAAEAEPSVGLELVDPEAGSSRMEQDLLPDLQGLELGEDALDVADVDPAESLQ